LFSSLLIFSACGSAAQLNRSTGQLTRIKTVAYSAYLIMPKIIGVVDFKKYVGLREIKEDDFKIF